MKSIVLAVNPNESVKPGRFESVKAVITYFFKRYGLISFFIFLLLSGMVTGASCAGIKNDEMIGKVLQKVTEHILIENDSAAISVFADSFTFSFVFAAAMLIMSLSPFGILIIPLIVFSRGFYCGIVSGHLCVTYGLRGLAYYIFVMLIGTFLSSLALVYISQYCLDFSVSVFREIFCKNNYVVEALRNKLGEMLLNISYMLILIGFASLADTVLYFIIGGLFSF